MAIDINQEIMFNDEKLFYRKKFSFFNKDNLKVVVLYFVSEEGIYCPNWGDYIEFNFLQENRHKFNEILVKESLSLEDIAELTITAGLISDYYKTHVAELIDSLRTELKNVNIDALYFSFYYH